MASNAGSSHSYWGAPGVVGATNVGLRQTSAGYRRAGSFERGFTQVDIENCNVGRSVSQRGSFEDLTETEFEGQQTQDGGLANRNIGHYGRAGTTDSLVPPNQTWPKQYSRDISYEWNGNIYHHQNSVQGPGNASGTKPQRNRTWCIRWILVAVLALVVLLFVLQILWCCWIHNWSKDDCYPDAVTVTNFSGLNDVTIDINYKSGFTQSGTLQYQRTAQAERQLSNNSYDQVKSFTVKANGENIPYDIPCYSDRSKLDFVLYVRTDTQRLTISYLDLNKINAQTTPTNHTTVSGTCSGQKVQVFNSTNNPVTMVITYGVGVQAVVRVEDDKGLDLNRLLGGGKETPAVSVIQVLDSTDGLDEGYDATIQSKEVQALLKSGQSIGEGTGAKSENDLMGYPDCKSGDNEELYQIKSNGTNSVQLVKVSS